MAESDRLWIRDDGSVFGMVEDYKDRHGHDDRSKAARELMRVGYQESRSPVLYRLKDVGIYGAFVFLILAIATVPLGYVTAVLSNQQTAWLAVSFVVLGVFWLSIVELLRTVARGRLPRWSA